MFLREQITAAATRLGLTLSGFVPQSALQSSAVIEKKVSVPEPQPAEPERELVVVELEPSGHWVDASSSNARTTDTWDRGSGPVVADSILWF
jgi:hypothetical protein